MVKIKINICFLKNSFKITSKEFGLVVKDFGWVCKYQISNPWIVLLKKLASMTRLLAGFVGSQGMDLLKDI